MPTDTQLRDLDPRQPAPPVVLPRDAARDQVGHGRTVPLVGGARPYLLEVVFDQGRQRVYADSPADALTAIIPGYAQKVAAVAQAGRDDAAAALADAFLARFDHADALRRKLQQQVNEEAEASGAWDTLDDEEREQCTLSASSTPDSPPPVGVIYEVPVDSPFGDVTAQDVGFWTCSSVHLVINRGDYGILDEDYLEPRSWLETAAPDGGAYVIEGVWPTNMTVLDPTDDEVYLESLGRAGLVTVDVVVNDLPDEAYVAALELGRQLLADG